VVIKHFLKGILCLIYFWGSFSLAKAESTPHLIIADFRLSSTIICEGECISITDYSQDASTWAWRFEGSMMTNTSLVNPPNQCYPTAGTYPIRLIVTDGSNRDTMIKLIRVVPLPNVDLGNDTTICEFQSVRLDATLPNATYQWSTGENTPFITVQESGNYIVETTRSTCQASDTIYITTIETPFIDLGQDKILCADEVMLLDVFHSDALTYSWQNNSTSSMIEVTESGQYFVEVQYSSGCSNSDTIAFYPEVPLEFSLPIDTFFCKNNQLILNAYQEQIIEYEWITPIFYWSVSLKNESISITERGIYTLNIKNDCFEITQEILVEEQDCGCYPFVPTAFSPNNDGENDEFKIYANCEILNFNLKVFDRWGGLVFSSKKQETGWQGTINNKIAPNGVYVWLLEYEAKTERGTIEPRINKGSVVLMK
jgi:gliding motility-associated-like protein